MNLEIKEKSTWMDGNVLFVSMSKLAVACLLPIFFYYLIDLRMVTHPRPTLKYTFSCSIQLRNKYKWWGQGQGPIDPRNGESAKLNSSCLLSLWKFLTVNTDYRRKIVHISSVSTFFFQQNIWQVMQVKGFIIHH